MELRLKKKVMSYKVGDRIRVFELTAEADKFYSCALKGYHLAETSANKNITVFQLFSKHLIKGGINCYFFKKTAKHVCTMVITKLK